MARPSTGKWFRYAPLGRRIRAAREQTGKTQTQVAFDLKFKSVSQYQKIESGEHAPSLEMLVKLLPLIGRSLDELLLSGDIVAEKPSVAGVPASPAIQVTHPAGYELPETDEPAEDDDGPDEPEPSRPAKRPPPPPASKRHHHR